MMAPDLPLEPAPRNDFSSSMTRPARRLARLQAMAVPMTPPPTIRMSHCTAMVVPSRGKVPVERRNFAIQPVTDRADQAASKLTRLAAPGHALGDALCGPPVLFGNAL